MEKQRENSRWNGSAFGCLTAALIFLSVGFILLFALAWGGAHCEPIPQCRQENGWRFLTGIALLLFAACLAGLLAHQAARFISRAARTWPGPAAFLMKLVVALLVAWLGFEATMRFLLFIN